MQMAFAKNGTEILRCAQDDKSPLCHSEERSDEESLTRCWQGSPSSSPPAAATPPPGGGKPGRRGADPYGWDNRSPAAAELCPGAHPVYLPAVPRRLCCASVLRGVWGSIFVRDPHERFFSFRLHPVSFLIDSEKKWGEEKEKVMGPRVFPYAHRSDRDPSLRSG